MAIDHDSRSKELRLKNRRVKDGGGHETEEDEEEAAGAGAGAEAQEQDEVMPASGGERCPPWLRPLLSASFYTHCEAHAYSRRAGGCTMFCLDCAAGALCHLCLAHGHRGHSAIQIRRSSYCNVIRVLDIKGLLDIAGVQTYVINSARVVFLNERPQAQAAQQRLPAGTKICQCCSRALLDNSRFCSLGCKFAACCSHDSNISSSSPLRSAVTQTSTPPLPPPILLAKRRKGIPHRAPFGNLIVD